VTTRALFVRKESCGMARARIVDGGTASTYGG